MNYKIEYSTRALKQLKKFNKPTQKEVIKKIQKISENPFLAKPLSNMYKNFRSERTGKNRIVFSIKENTIIISKIEHRKGAYK